jgi:hypothetical protein
MIAKVAGAAYESTGIVDTKNKLPVRTTARVRAAYRKMKPDEPVRWYDQETGQVVDGIRRRLPNYYASKMIETEFVSSHEGVPEDGHFPLDDGSTGEIRFMVSASGDYYDVFVSSIKAGSVDIISFQRGYFKKGPGWKKKSGVAPKGPIWYSGRWIPKWVR